MSRQLTIYGTSDDLVDVQVDGRYVHEFDLPYAGEGPSSATYQLSDGTRSLFVTATFESTLSENGWEIGVSGVDGKAAPWPVVFGVRPDRDDDPAVTITIPDEPLTLTHTVPGGERVTV